MIVTRERAEFKERLPLVSGRELRSFELVYETYGTLDAAGSNAILVCHGLTGNAHAAGRYTDDPGEKPGWWDAAIGPGKVFDTDRFFVLSSNVLAGSGGSTGPASINPVTGHPYGLDFPVVTIADMAAAQARLADRLGIKRFHAVAGGCMGGFQVLEWMAGFPDRVGRAICISATPWVSAHTLALWEVIRQAIRLDPAYGDGDYYGKSYPRAGVNLGTRFGMLIWMSRAVMEKRFGRRLIGGKEPSYTLEPEFEIQEFLSRVGNISSEPFDPNSLIYLTRAMDYFDLSRGRAPLAEAFKEYRSPALLVSYRTDWRYPPEEVDLIRKALKKNGVPVTHLVLESAFSHGAFLYDFKSLSGPLREFLE